MWLTTDCTVLLWYPNRLNVVWQWQSERRDVELGPFCSGEEASCGVSFHDISSSSMCNACACTCLHNVSMVCCHTCDWKAKPPLIPWSNPSVRKCLRDEWAVCLLCSVYSLYISFPIPFISQLWFFATMYSHWYTCWCSSSPSYSQDLSPRHAKVTHFCSVFCYW